MHTKQYLGLSLIVFFLLTTSRLATCQGKSILVYDFESELFDTISTILNTELLEHENTSHNIGNFNMSFQELNEVPPTNNLIPGTSYTKKKKVSLDFDKSNFPIRTTVKIFSIVDGVPLSLCSGSLISKRHVLGAAHCFLENNNINQVSVDSILVCPIVDNGELSTDFECSLASKLYFIKDRIFSKEDISLLELKKPIGSKTGWIGIGFNNNLNFYDEGIYYKFSYPSSALPILDPIDYNGDTLYYNYGNINRLNEYLLGVIGASAIPGESGSSLINIKNDTSYVSHGVLTYASYTHIRIRDWMFFTFQKIISDDISNSINPIKDNKAEIRIYPNPVEQIVSVDNGDFNNILKVYVLDHLGNKVLNFPKPLTQIDFTELPNGVYFIVFQKKESQEIKRIIKAGKL